MTATSDWCDVSPDARSFVMIRSSEASKIQLIQNWAAQLQEP